MSFEGEIAPAFDLRCLHEGHRPPDGWGLGYYPGDEPSASLLKEGASQLVGRRVESLRAWEHLPSSLFLLHLRTATWGGPTPANTQPFCRTWGGRDWLFAHAGSLHHRLSSQGLFEPVGATDTEMIFCELLNRISARGWKNLGDVDLVVLHNELRELNTHGTLSVVLTDGRDLVAYADQRDEVKLYTWSLVPPYGALAFADDDVEVNLASRQVSLRKGMMVSSAMLQPTDGQAADWKTLAPGELIVLRQGVVRARVGGDSLAVAVVPLQGGRSLPPRPAQAFVRRLQVTHRTIYRYQTPVQRSIHFLRLMPIHDRLQTLLHYNLQVSVDANVIEYDDVFGNRVRKLRVDTPFTELRIEAHSQVELLDTDPLSYRPPHARSSIPLVWMPWQRRMLEPYLLPPELPESELEELAKYAMSFVERNDYDLLDTLLDMNATIYREYAYRPATTNLQTTAFDVYIHRRGVCQDFANLFICLARLLGVPARYMCGYIYTGPKHENYLQSEASHAWVQMYLPEVGWKGFDPTNGIITQTDHIRLAMGRMFVDATPTAGTIYLGGQGESLEVDVVVMPLALRGGPAAIKCRVEQLRFARIAKGSGIR